MNQNLKPRVPDPRAGFDPVHHTSHRILAGLTRNPDLKVLIKQSAETVMIRNAIIALGNIGSEPALRFLQTYGKNVAPCYLTEYIEFATVQIKARLERHNRITENRTQ